MVFVEIFEFMIKPGNKAEVQAAAARFAQAAPRVPGLRRMEFLRDPANEKRLWQLLYWETDESRSGGMPALFSLPEMGLFSMFLDSPPKRVDDFESLT